MKPFDLKATCAAIAAAVLMATIGVIARKTGVPAEALTFFRLFFGALFMGLFLLVTFQGTWIRRRPPWPVLLNGALLAAFIVFYIQAVTFTTMATAILLVYLAPVLASVFAHFFLGEKLGRVAFACIMLALLGFAMVMNFHIDVTSDTSHLKGVGFALLAMLAYASFILLNRHMGSFVHPYTSTFYQLLAGAAVMLPFVVIAKPTFHGEQWLWLTAAGFFPGFLAVLFSVVALKQLRASTFGTLSYFEPLAVVAFGSIFFDEFLSPMQWAGCSMILISGAFSAFFGGRLGAPTSVKGCRYRHS